MENKLTRKDLTDALIKINESLNNIKDYRTQELSPKGYKDQLNLIDDAIMNNPILKEEVYRRGNYFANLKTSPNLIKFQKRLFTFIEKCSQKINIDKLESNSQKEIKEILNPEKYELDLNNPTAFFSQYRNIFDILKLNAEVPKEKLSRYEKLFDNIERKIYREIQSINHGLFKMYLYHYNYKDKNEVVAKYYTNKEKDETLSIILRTLKIFCEAEIKKYPLQIEVNNNLENIILFYSNNRMEIKIGDNEQYFSDKIETYNTIKELILHPNENINPATLAEKLKISVETLNQRISRIKKMLPELAQYIPNRNKHNNFIILKLKDFQISQF